MAHFISDHTPLNDYQRLLRHLDYYIENADVNKRLPSNNRNRLNESPAYKIILKALKVMLVISGLSMLFTAIILWTYVNICNSHTFQSILLFCIFIVAGSFFLTLLISCLGGYMETHSERKDRKTKSIQESKTWVLLNGCIVVAYMQYGRGGQMVKPFVMDEKNIVDIPFSRMDVIDKVHRIHNKNGKVIADVDATEYYITHPYVNEVPSDNISHYFHYYKRRKRRKIQWYSNMLGIDRLINALNALKH